jgi:hypothetical protein
MRVLRREHEDESSEQGPGPPPALGPSPGQAFERVPPDEQLHIDRLIDNIRKLLQDRYAGKQTLRDAHPKMHGLVQAQLEVASDVPRELAHGLFAEPGKIYKAWARLSNQHQDPSPDARRDTRGLALKLLDVPGDKLLDGEESSPCHDFIFLSTPRFVARDVAEFDELINAVVQKSLWSALRSLPAGARHLLSLRRHTSPLETTYFSVVPSLLGPCPVKLTIAPQDSRRSALPRPPGKDYLRERMVEQLRERDHVFDVLVQRYVDARRTPIEDPTVQWPSERERVASLRIVKQEFDTPARRELGENLAFNPFRCLPEHRPLGGINRARRQVYRAISKFRLNRNGVVSKEPPGW